MPAMTANDLYRREREDRERDIIRIFNPLDHDFIYKYDGRNWKVPAKSSKDEPRYLAEKFVHDICNYIIDQRIINKGESLIEDMRMKGGNSIDLEDPLFLNTKIWDKVDQASTRDKMRAEIIPLVVLGIVSRYGEDEEQVAQPIQKRLSGNIEDQLFSEATKKIVSELKSDVIEPVAVKPTKTKPVTAKEVTNEG